MTLATLPRLTRIRIGPAEQAASEFPYRYVWKPRFVAGNLPVLDRKGQLCRILEAAQ